MLSFADDKSGASSRSSISSPSWRDRADPIEEPNFYFGNKPEATAAMDALLATRGYRKFEWQPVFEPAAAAAPSTTRRRFVAGMRRCAPAGRGR